jgi:hypothetical protein
VSSQPDWSRPLPRPLTIPTVMKLSTLADVRDLVEKHLPAPYRRKPSWRHVSTQLAEAAKGEKDLLEICVSLRLVLALEGGGMPDEIGGRHFPPPWTVDENPACFIVKDRNGQAWPASAKRKAPRPVGRTNTSLSKSIQISSWPRRALDNRQPVGPGWCLPRLNSPLAGYWLLERGHLRTCSLIGQLCSFLPQTVTRL